MRMVTATRTTENTDQIGTELLFKCQAPKSDIRFPVPSDIECISMHRRPHEILHPCCSSSSALAAGLVGCLAVVLQVLVSIRARIRVSCPTACDRALPWHSWHPNSGPARVIISCPNGNNGNNRGTLNRATSRAPRCALILTPNAYPNPDPNPNLLSLTRSLLNLALD